MDWVKDVLLPVCQTGIWAAMVYLLGAKALKQFEQTISRTLDRLKKAGPAEFEPITSSTQLTVAVDPEEAASALPEATQPDSLQAYFECKLKETLPPGSPAERETFLLRGLASMQIAWLLETLNFLIYGSQLVLVDRAKSGPVPLETARGIYEAAESLYPDFYKTYAFEGWLFWLTDVAKLLRQDDVSIVLTDEGREFLKYVITRGYSFNRFG